MAIPVQSMDTAQLAEELRDVCIQIGRHIEAKTVDTDEHRALVRRADEVHEALMRRTAW